ncbi:hypothetical protein [Streptomyces sp. NPDC051132]|uniref:hypothetical protein n=1 Tax=unclassified Streptomyces TaxID=2593676 RepID=UPI00342B952F
MLVNVVEPARNRAGVEEEVGGERVHFPLFALNGPGGGPVALTAGASTSAVRASAETWVVPDDILTVRLGPEATEPAQ